MCGCVSFLLVAGNRSQNENTSDILNDLKAVGVVGVIGVYHKYSRID